MVPNPEPEFYCKIDGEVYIERYFSGNGIDSVHTARWIKFKNYDSTTAYKVLLWIRSKSNTGNSFRTFNFSFNADSIVLYKEYLCKDVEATNNVWWSDITGSVKVLITKFDGKYMSGVYSWVTLKNWNPATGELKKALMTDGSFTNFPEE